jgi:hypothetical protein
MGQSAKLERQGLSKHANITFLTFIASTNQGTLQLESHILSRSTLYKFTINSQVRSFTIRYYFLELTIYS